MDAVRGLIQNKRGGGRKEPISTPCVWGQLGQSASRLPACGACNKAQPGTRGHAPHCGFPNSLGWLRGNSEYASRANFLRCLLLSATFAPQRFFIACCGRALRGTYDPLRARPRKSRMPSQATSGWANVGAPSTARHFFSGASPGVARPNQPPLSSVAVERVTLD